MGMHQKRNMRKIKKEFEENTGVRKSGINWLVTIYLNLRGIPYK